MTNPLNEYLANLNGAVPEMSELHRLGVPLSEAVEICAARHVPQEPAPEPLLKRAVSVADALSKLPRFAQEPEFKLAELTPSDAPKLNLDMYMPPVPRAAAHQEPVGELSALSKLHTLSQMLDSPRPCVTVLVNEGFSEHTAHELCNLIRSANPIEVVKPGD